MFSMIFVKEREREQLWNLLQKYLCELSVYFDDEVDEKGNFPYEHFDEYFTDPTRRAYIIYDGDSVAGFVMLNKVSVFGEDIDHSVAEFFILPKFRHTGLATDIFLVLRKQFKGAWEIKYHVDNVPAVKFWTKVTSTLEPEVRDLNEKEKVLSFLVK